MTDTMDPRIQDLHDRLSELYDRTDELNGGDAVAIVGKWFEDIGFPLPTHDPDVAQDSGTTPQEDHRDDRPRQAARPSHHRTSCPGRA